jgi:Chaperone of endosialidase
MKSKTHRPRRSRFMRAACDRSPPTPAEVADDASDQRVVALDKLAPIVAHMARTSRGMQPKVLAISGIDGSGKSHIAAGLEARLKASGIRTAVIGVDLWHTSRAERFAPLDSARVFYEHAFRWPEFFSALVDPLVRLRSFDRELEVRRLEDDSLYSKRYQFSEIEIVLIEGIFLLRREYVDRYDPDVVNSDGQGNTAMGTDALFSLTPSQPYGSYNTASGYEALYNNTNGAFNTASGFQALYASTTGSYNTASGYYALISNTTASNNTAFGFAALANNTTGVDNTATGYSALFSDTLGGANTASGVNALVLNTTGSNNTASGADALHSNTTGYDNTASGMNALYSNTTGINNVAEGFQAGYYLTTGSNNIDIGNPGAAVDKGIIRIGVSGTQKAAFIAGIYGTSVSGHAVMISSKGRLGVVVSSERFKTDITPLNSDKLLQLRPVSFHLKSDPKGVLQYGLIAEEVAKVYPDLVIRDGSGRIDGVRYDELAPMLLNELQQQQQHSAAQDAKISQLMGELTEMHAALVKLQGKSELVAQR